MARLRIVASALLVLGFGFTCFFWYRWSIQRSDYQRLFQSIELRNQELATLRLENGRLATQNQVLSLKRDEFVAVFPDLADEIRRLKVRLAQVQSINTTGFAVSTPATVFLRDSILFDTIQKSYFDYDDGFFSVRGKSIGNQQHLELGYHDTLVQVVYWGERERPWLWIFSRRKLKQRVSLKNPNASITFSEYIQIADPQ
jgi:hypothetical protein